METVTKRCILPWQLKISVSLVFALATGVVLQILGKPIPWQLEMCLTMASALGVSAAMLLVPKKQLASISRCPGLSPNCDTLWGLVFYSIGFTLYIKGYHYSGFMLGVIGGVFDVIDGKKAVAQYEFGVWRSPRSKRIGKWLDPASDKIKFLPTLALASTAGIIDYRIVLWIIIFEVFGTLIRNPINIGVRLAWATKKLDKGNLRQAIRWASVRLVRKSKASGFGKTKTVIQALGLIVCILYYRKWYLDLPAIPNLIYLFALALGIASIVSRMRIHPAFDRFMDRVGDAGSLFKHRDFEMSNLLTYFRRENV